MGRWEPDPRGRLAKAAVELFVAQGFDRTTGAQIAARAGMHERSFFRLFPDKRDVFFHSMETMRREAVAVIAGAPEGTSPIDAVVAAFAQRCEAVQRNRRAAIVRKDLLAANPELRERDLTKHTELAAAMAAALRERGAAEQAATLAAETAMWVFRGALARWYADPEHQDLPTLFRDDLDALSSVLADRSGDRASDHASPTRSRP
ncbi:TetR family transcriptional regulator [Actinacidiphila sp. DG2A-62]|uniref:TetR/AcrR family transcriptional regulator n=1 Tax=Actinacidiphila sp. DG2A-62 TaxID=3108821 RepID=UPI002DBE2C49|nr:TetR family transcriptional regulator [Actinacidiphila sp. DG2A-62]MEC3993756.1 TetR family transcriptional regulator [Actinacidiphila sp. DG2A-62]